ncbi:hypothetical protein G7Y89_g13833 [Cudoniella acicularis]|uniref:C3H1-type domain-containing protein n=1 Tax=Cudoniella acicularis TaxID=354080 RepID=A0A8H4R6H0_9HELO|nr:hypothetical protein G7Y89_g13833 [Cudoniella acicularis]
MSTAERRTLPPSQVDCKWWMSGFCTRGKSCYFRHDEAKAGIQSKPAAAKGAADDASRAKGKQLYYSTEGTTTECIRTWRASKTESERAPADELRKTRKTCPMCRSHSDYIIPSSIFPIPDKTSGQDTENTRKKEIVDGYLSKLKTIRCRYFEESIEKSAPEFKPKCQFGNTCHYLHIHPITKEQYTFSQEELNQFRRRRPKQRSTRSRTSTIEQMLIMDMLFNEMALEYESADDWDDDRVPGSFYTDVIYEPHHLEFGSDFAFGFSFGDFVSAIGILNSIRKALRETSGAKDNFRNFCSELEHLEVLLKHLHRETWDHGADAGHINAVKGMALTVKIPLQEFLGKVEKLRSMINSLDGTGRFSGVRHSVVSKARQAQWAVQMKDEVEKLRAVIVAKIFAINLLIQLNIVSTTSKIESGTKIIEEHSSKCRDAVDGAANELREVKNSQAAMRLEINRLVHICTGTKVGVQDIQRDVKVHTSLRRHILIISDKVNSEADMEVHAILRQVQNSIIRTPGLMMEDCLKFTDALGRTQQLAYRWFRYWDVFESMLRCEFRRLPGEDRVLRGQYILLKGRGQKSIIDREQWENPVFPSSEVGMSMTIDDEVLWVGIYPRPGCCARITLLPGDMGTIICKEVEELETGLGNSSIPDLAAENLARRAAIDSENGTLKWPVPV